MVIVMLVVDDDALCINYFVETRTLLVVDECG